MNTNSTFLEELEDIIRARIQSANPSSYTSQLVESGKLRVAQKVGEEAVEVALAAATENSAELLQESADLIFHLLVLLNCHSVRLTDVCDVLQQRHVRSV